jgi:uncharacterized protein (TIGR02680 family)
MTDAIVQPSHSRPALPKPQRERWQPLRLGLVELFHYDSEEFWFRDGHLLLRGNNGTGKSKALSLTLPFLFDAQLRPSRIEPDGDNGKKMAWNLLMNSYQRRIGYAWIEFGRLQSNGRARYLTLGAGLLAVEGKPQVDPWFFVLEGDGEGQDPRIGQDLWLTSNQRVVLTQKQLRELVEGQGFGTVFDNAPNYRRAVDERLFHLGTKRYEALMDTLIQLRQPQLARKPDENGLSHALTEALPPMPPELLGDVAEALNQLEEDREQLEKTRQLEHAIKQFEHRYRVYAGTLTRRQARELRQAQTAFDNASEERNKALSAFQQAEEAAAAATISHEAAKRSLLGAQARRETLQSDPANQDANRLSQAEQDAKDRIDEATAAGEKCDLANSHLTREEELSQKSHQHRVAAQDELNSARAVCASEAELSGTTSSIARNALIELPPDQLTELAATQFTSAASELREAANKRREGIRHLEQSHVSLAEKQSRFNAAQERQRERQEELEEAERRRGVADQDAEAAGMTLIDTWTKHYAGLKQLTFDAAEAIEQLIVWTASPEGPNPMHTALAEAYAQASLRHAARQSDLEATRDNLQRERTALIEEKDRLAAGHDAVPLPPATRGKGVREGRPGSPLWQLVDFRPHVQADQRAGLEASLEASGLLDAWIAPDGSLTNASGSPLWDTQWLLRPTIQGDSLLGQLLPVTLESASVAPHLVETLLAGVACGASDNQSAESWVSVDGRYRLGALSGAWNKSEAVYIGQTARAQARQRRLQEIFRQLQALDAQDAVVSHDFEALSLDKARADSERRGAPSDDPLLLAVATAKSAEHAVMQARSRLDSADAQCGIAEAEFQAEREKLERDAADLRLPSARDDLSVVASAVNKFSDAYPVLVQSARELRNAWLGFRQQQEREAEARGALAQRKEELAAATSRAETARARYAVLYESIGAKVETLRQQLAEAVEKVRQADADVNARQKAMINAIEARGIAGSTKDRAEEQLNHRTAVRSQAVERLQRFTESGLLASALPELPIPDSGTAWTIDPALQLARRVEQALAHISDDDATWSRIQRQVSEDLTELQPLAQRIGIPGNFRTQRLGFHRARPVPEPLGTTEHLGGLSER